MRKSLRNQQIQRTVLAQGADVLSSEGHKKSEKYIQHGDTTMRDHTISVACMCVNIAQKTHLKYDYSALVRGALLHDYFQYDWHAKNHPKRHGWRHASLALENAADDFSINPVEADMIKKHMFPLNITAVPRYKETFVLTLADKICSFKEVFSKPFYADVIDNIEDNV